MQKIIYTKKSKINIEDGNISGIAKTRIKDLKDNDDIVLRVSINSPVYIEAAAPLTSEGIREVCSIN